MMESNCFFFFYNNHYYLRLNFYILFNETTFKLNRSRETINNI